MMADDGRQRARGQVVAVELVRLAVVVLGAVTAAEIASQPWAGSAGEVNRLLLTALGTGIGYVAGGVLGRFAIERIEDASERLEAVPAGELVAGALGGVVGLILSAGLTWPVLVFGGKAFTLPLAVLTVCLATWFGLRVGARRGADLLRYVGVAGRLPASGNAVGGRLKVLDTSALIDGRIIDVCRAGFLEGTLVVPQFVLVELQALADAGDEERRRRGQRGLDVLTHLQRSSGNPVEVLDDDPVEESVDAKLVAVARRRGAALVTVDTPLARVAEVQGVRVLSLHRLAEDLRPPVLPGDGLHVRITKPGKEPGQGVGYLQDGTMVVVEGARERIGDTVACEVTGVLSNPNGRMVFASVQAGVPSISEG